MATPSPLSIRLTNGIDTKDDELVQSEMLVLENAVFDRPGSYRKRNGYDRFNIGVPSTPGASGTDIPVSFATFRNELLALTDTQAVSRLLTGLGWTTSRGDLVPLAIAERYVWSNRASESSDLCVLNNVAVITSGGYVAVYDALTWSCYVQPTVLPSPSATKRLFALANNRTIRLVSALDGYYDFDTFFPPTSLPAPTPAVFGPTHIDAIGDSSAATVMWASGSGVGARNDGGLPTSTPPFTVLGAATNAFIGLCADSATSNRWWAAINNGGGGSWSLTIGAFSSAATPAVVRAATAVESGSGYTPVSVAITFNGSIAHVFYTLQSTTDTKRLITRYRAYDNSAGSFIKAASTIAFHSFVTSKAFNYAKRGCVWLVYSATPTHAGNTVAPNTMLLVMADAAGNVALQGRAVYEACTDLIGQSPSNIDPCAVVTMQDGSMATIRSKVSGADAAGFVLSSPAIVSLAPKTFYQSAVQADGAYINSALLVRYDGLSLVEDNFSTAPVISSTATATTGGQLSNGSYSAIAVFVYQTATGEIIYSRPSDPVTVALAGGTSAQTFTVAVKGPAITRTGALYAIYLYRTLLNGQLYYPERVAAAVDAEGWSNTNLLGQATDLTISARPTLYTTSAVRNDPLPHTNFIAKAGDRLWGHPGDGVLWYSKKRIVGRSVEFSALNTKLLSTFSDPVAMAELPGKRYLVFSSTQVASFSEDGIDGNGNPIFSDDEVLLRAIGCADPLSVTNVPGGVLFKSQRGWWLIADSLQDTYIGAEVESYNDYGVAGATVLLAKNQVHVALRGVGAPVLVYDTFAQKWSTDLNTSQFAGVNPSFVAQATWGGVTQQLDTNGFQWSQVPGGFQDSTYPIIMRGRTGWIAPAGPQAYIRNKQILLYGQKKSDHNLIVRLRYDYKEDIAETYTFPAGPDVPATDDYQWRIKDPKIQKCRAISIEFLDDFTGYTPGEGYTLNAIDLVVEPKTGAAKIAAARSVAGV